MQAAQGLRTTCGGDGGDDCEEEGKLGEDCKGFCEEMEEEDGDDENGQTRASLSLHSMAFFGEKANGRIREKQLL